MLAHTYNPSPGKLSQGANRVSGQQSDLKDREREERIRKNGSTGLSILGCHFSATFTLKEYGEALCQKKRRLWCWGWSPGPHTAQYPSLQAAPSFPFDVSSCLPSPNVSRKEQEAFHEP